MFHMFYDIEKARTEVARTSFVYSLKEQNHLKGSVLFLKKLLTVELVSANIDIQLVITN